MIYKGNKKMKDKNIEKESAQKIHCKIIERNDDDFEKTVRMALKWINKNNEKIELINVSTPDASWGGAFRVFMWFKIKRSASNRDK